jgi:hypothetical protein
VPVGLWRRFGPKGLGNLAQALAWVAQYEVLGNDAKKKCPSRKRKGRSKHSAFCFGRVSAIAGIRRSSRSSVVVLTMADKPGRILFKNANPALRTGLLSSGPCGTHFLSSPTDLGDPNREALKLMRIGSRRIPIHLRPCRDVEIHADRYRNQRPTLPATRKRREPPGASKNGNGLKRSD